MANKNGKVAFATGFRPPDLDEIENAIGKFPLSPERCTWRKSMLLNEGEARNISEVSIDMVQEKKYFQNVNARGKKVWNALPLPADEESWLAKYPEPGQTFTEYTNLITLRSGRFRSNACPNKPLICFVPILTEHDNSCWPSYAPNLHELVKWTSAFFDRDVEILPPATVEMCTNEDPYLAHKRAGSRNKTRVVWRHPFMQNSRIEGRIAPTSPSVYQVHVDGVLNQLSQMMCPRRAAVDDRIARSYTVMGITMVDLYSCDTDLFVAGMASPGLKTAVFSFARYHPRIKMRANLWYDYGYAARSSQYPYFEDDVGRKTKGINKKIDVVSDIPQELDDASRAEYLRRAGKLVVHELCHVYGIDHCIHYHCLMNGTGHLVEDFAAPAHLCGVCLRKLHFRLGFDVVARYAGLREVFRTNGLKKECVWVCRRLAGIGIVDNGVPSSSRGDVEGEVEDTPMDDTATEVLPLLPNRTGVAAEAGDSCEIAADKSCSGNRRSKRRKTSGENSVTSCNNDGIIDLTEEFD